MKYVNHKTTHVCEADEEGYVLVLCETCGWKTRVYVYGLAWKDAMGKIYAVRDAHEANPEPKEKP